MNPQPAVYLAAIDDTDAAPHVVEVASALAQRMGPAELHLVHAVDPGPREAALAGPIVMPITDLLEERKKVVDGLVAEAKKRFAGPVHGHVVIGRPATEVLRLASSLSADLLVVGTANKTGLQRLILGSVAEQIARKAKCPVLIARRKLVRAARDETIEPACPDCVAARASSDGETLWCERHAARHARARTHYETPAPFAVGSMLLRPEE